MAAFSFEWCSAYSIACSLNDTSYDWCFLDILNDITVPHLEKTPNDDVTMIRSLLPAYPAFVRDPAFISTFRENPRRLLETRRLMEVIRVL